MSVIERFTVFIVVSTLITLHAAASLRVPATAGTLEYPVKGRTITMVVPSTAGGGTDTAARLIAPLMQKDLGAPSQVVNKPGASMQIGLSDVAFNSIGELLGHLKSGTIRILGVMDEQESGFLPGVKTLEAQGYQAQPIGSDLGLSSPAGLPKAIIDLLTNAVRKAMGDEESKKKMTEQGNTLRYLSPQEYAAHWDRADARFKPVIDLAKKQGE